MKANSNTGITSHLRLTERNHKHGKESFDGMVVATSRIQPASSSRLEARMNITELAAHANGGEPPQRTTLFIGSPDEPQVGTTSADTLQVQYVAGEVVLYIFIDQFITHSTSITAAKFRNQISGWPTLDRAITQAHATGGQIGYAKIYHPSGQSVDYIQDRLRREFYRNLPVDIEPYPFVPGTNEVSFFVGWQGTDHRVGYTSMTRWGD